MGLDIRIPIGVMFSLMGVVLAVFGWFSDPALYRRSLGININLWWGLALLAFGAAMLLLSFRRSAATHPAGAPPATPLPEADARTPSHLKSAPPERKPRL